MFGKEALLSIFKDLPTSKMITALSNAGVNVSESLIPEDSLLDDLQESQANIWGDYRVPLWATDNRPKNLLDPSAIVELSPMRTTMGSGRDNIPKDALFTENLLGQAEGGF